MANSTTRRFSPGSGSRSARKAICRSRRRALAVYETLKALRDGVVPKDLKGVPSADFVNRYMRNSADPAADGGFSRDQARARRWRYGPYS